MNTENFVRNKLKDARKAVAREAFNEARALFAEVLQRPNMESDIDLQLRYAYCAERSGDYIDAVNSYRKVASIYRDQGEQSAADKLEARIEGLEQTKQGVREGEKMLASEGIRRTQSSMPPMGRHALIRRLCQLGATLHLKQGDVLCRTGDPPAHLWLLRSGTLSVLVEDYEEKEVMTPKPGGLMLVGEGGFFTRQRREATLIAQNETEVIEIGRDVIMVEQHADPSFAAAMDVLLLDYWIDPVLSRHDIFARVNDVDRHRLAREFETIEVDAGQILIEAGKEHDAAYMVLSGCAILMHTDSSLRDDKLEDDGALTTSLFPAEMINLGGLLRSYISPYKVVAATPLQLLRLSRDRFEPYTLRRSWIVNAIMKVSSKPVHLQVVKPDESYRWFIDRHVDVSI